MLIKYFKPILVILLSLNPFTLFQDAGVNDHIAWGQITPDNSLGSERSRVTTKKNKNQEITGGARRGNNLFHSFKEFGVPQGRGAYFIPQGNIVNIFTRVTGKNLSNIQGILGVRGNANLFLLNPNGIIFGKNAQLNLKGSFIGSTGESFLFSDGSQFSATNPQPPPMLTVNVSAPIGIKFGNQPAIIVNQSQPGLNVEPNQTLGLLGGGIQIEQGNISAPSSQIILGAVGSNNTINLTETPTGSYQVSYLGVKEFGDLSLSGGAKVYTNGNGSIEIQGRNLTLTQGSQIYSISGDEAAGAIQIKATDISLTGLDTNIYSKSSGKGIGSDITINTGKLTAQEGAQIYAHIIGSGQGGNIQVKATNSIEFSGVEVFTRVEQDKIKNYKHESGLRAHVLKTATGNSGDIIVETAKLLIFSGAQIAAHNYSRGNVGSIRIKATEEVQAKGVEFYPDGTFKGTTGLFALVFHRASGKGGDINVETQKLTLSEAGRIATSTLGAGKAGNVRIKATEEVKAAGIKFDKTNNRAFIGGIFAEVRQGSTGTGGNITIDTQKLTLASGAQIIASTFGSGNSGNFSIVASKEVKVTGTVFYSTGVTFASGIYTQVFLGASGKGGSINMHTEKLTVADGAMISASTLGTGDAGNVNILATRQIKVTGARFHTTSEFNTFSQISAEVQVFPNQLPASGKGGNLTVETGKLIVSSGGRVSTSTFAQGDAGNIVVNATKEIRVTGIAFDNNGKSFPSEISATVEERATGKGGNLTINTENLLVDDRSRITADSKSSSGMAGNINISTSDISLADQGLISTNTQQGNGGNINITAYDLLELSRESNISATAGNQVNGGNGGNINIDAKFIVADPFENSNITANAFSGSGGQVTINSSGLFGIQANSIDTQFTSDITASSEKGPQGTITINIFNVQPTPNAINLTAQPIPYRFGRLCENKNKGKTLEFYWAGRAGIASLPNDFLFVDTVNNPWLELVNQDQPKQIPQESQGNLTFESMALFLPCE